MQNRRHVVALVTGLVRAPEVFVRSLDPLARLRAEGVIDQIRFVTWESERAAHPDVFAMLAMNAVETVTLPPLPIQAVGWLFSYLVQVSQFQAGLRDVPGDSFVLRTRGDVVFDSLDGLRALLTRRMTLPGDDPVLSHRIWVAGANPFMPFYVNDQVWFGLGRDLHRCFRFDLAEDFLQPAGSQHLSPPEIRLGIRPFIDHFPHARLWQELMRSGALLLDDPWSVCIRHPVFWELLAVWYFILRRYFVLGHDGYAGRLLIARQPGGDGNRPMDAGEAGVYVDKLALAHVLPDTPPSAVFAMGPAEQAAGAMRQNAWLERLFAGGFADDPAGERLLRAFATGYCVPDLASRGAAMGALIGDLRAAR